MQEIERYNHLLRVIHASISDLQRATRGDILRSPELDAMFEAVYNSAVPAQWQTAYPSTKPLGPWTRYVGLCSALLCCCLCFAAVCLWSLFADEVIPVCCILRWAV